MSASAVEHPPSSIRVLVVEDEQDARDLLVSGLQRLGFAAAGARDGSEACQRLDDGWDVVVTDLLMPRLDGLGLLAMLRRDHPDLHRVVITSFGDKDRVLAAFNAGADYLLEKPFGVAQLVEIIRRLTDGQTPGRQLDRWFMRRLSGLDLTPRERDLVLLVLKGLGNKQIALHLELGNQTVKNALLTVYRKLGVNSRGELFHLIFPI